MSWLQQPALAGSLGVVVLYALGLRRRLRLVGAANPEWRRRGASLLAGLGTAVVVLGPSVDRWSRELLWVHMLQHVVLMSVAPPLIVLAAPWLPVWRGLPLRLRRQFARLVMRLPARVRAGFGRLRDPYVVFALAAAGLAVWHVPTLYTETLRNAGVHYSEHAIFGTLGLLFWLQVLESPPLRPRLSRLGRAGYTTAGAASGWVLALVLALAPAPLYAAYASLAQRPGGISAIGDQELAAGVMVSVGAIPFSVAVFVLIYQWLEEERPRPSRTAEALKSSPRCRSA